MNKEKSNAFLGKPVNYNIPAKLFHWILALLLIGMIALGWYMVFIEDQPGSEWYFSLHKSFGILTGSLILLRIIWTLSHATPALPTSIPQWQAIIARMIHWLLYACMILMPLTGFIGASLGKHGVKFFGLQIPTWIHQNHALSEKLFSLHGAIAWALVVLIALHVLAAFKHLLINKDKTFQRMWF